MAKGNGTGALFPKSAKTIFLNVTRTCYAHMQERFKKKNLPELPFTKDQFREYALAAFRNQYDGFVRCRYCLSHFNISDIAVDHAIPLSRGGGMDLDNLEFICKADNDRKGGLTPTEYLGLLEFLETLPFARVEILKRLEQSVKLAAGAAATRGTIGELKRGGQWGAAQAAIRAKKKG